MASETPAHDSGLRPEPHEPHWLVNLNAFASVLITVRVPSFVPTASDDGAHEARLTALAGCGNVRLGRTAQRRRPPSAKSVPERRYQSYPGKMCNNRVWIG